MGKTILRQISLSVNRRRVLLFMKSLSRMILCLWMGEGDTFMPHPFCKMAWCILNDISAINENYRQGRGLQSVRQIAEIPTNPWMSQYSTSPE